MTPAKPPASALSPGEQRIELGLEGVRSVLSGGFLALSQGQKRLEKLLGRIADGIDLQNQLLAQRNNGHGNHEQETDHG